MRAFSSVGQSNRLITGWSRVRIPEGPPLFRGIAQLVEQRSPKPRAEGSSPSAPAKNKTTHTGGFLFFVRVKAKPEAHGRSETALPYNLYNKTSRRVRRLRRTVWSALQADNKFWEPQKGLQSNFKSSKLPKQGRNYIYYLKNTIKVKKYCINLPFITLLI